MRTTYDTVAARYIEEIGHELDDKPFDGALLDGFAEMVGTSGPVGDVGCGPGHITRHLKGRGLDMIGVDLSPRMVEIASDRSPDIPFQVGSLSALGVRDAAWAAAVVLYSIIHLAPAERPAAYSELARALRPGAWMLVAFHVAMADHAPGSSLHLDEWWGHAVSIDTYFLDPAEVVGGLVEAGFTLQARIDREPWPGVELQSRRCYLLMRRTDR